MSCTAWPTTAQSYPWSPDDGETMCYIDFNTPSTLGVNRDSDDWRAYEKVCFKENKTGSTSDSLGWPCTSTSDPNDATSCQNNASYTYYMANDNPQGTPIVCADNMTWSCNSDSSMTSNSCCIQGNMNDCRQYTDEDSCNKDWLCYWKK